MQGRPTGVAKDVLDVLILQGADDHLAAGQLFHGSLPISLGVIH